LSVTPQAEEESISQSYQQASQPSEPLDDWFTSTADKDFVGSNDHHHLSAIVCLNHHRFFYTL
jgi:hypothetical protein